MVMIKTISLLTILSFLPVFASPITITVSYGLHETVDVNAYDNHPGLRSFLSTIDTSVLGESTYTYTIDEIEKSLTFVVSNTVTIVEPLVGYDAYIASFAFNETHAFVELFNPTIDVLNLDLYRIVINDNNYAFAEGATLAPLTSVKVPVTEGIEAPAFISETNPIVIHQPPVTKLWLLKQVDTFALFDTIPIASIMSTRFGTSSLSDYVFRRDAKTLTPSYVYDANEWLAYPNNIVPTPFALLEPTVTSLEQAKAWATYVMFGAGMFAAGRVEEAFRALETEYLAMAISSQQILFAQPNTIVRGVNENGQADQSTFREAIGRYNYLAARVPGAEGLNGPPAEPFTWITILYGLIAVVAFAGLFLFIKQRRQR